MEKFIDVCIHALKRKGRVSSDCHPMDQSLKKKYLPVGNRDYPYKKDKSYTNLINWRG